MKTLILFVFFLVKDIWTVFYKETIPMIIISTESKPKQYNKYHLYLYKVVDKDTVISVIPVSKSQYLKYKLNSKINM